MQFHGHMLLKILMVKKLLGHFMKKHCKKQTKKIRMEKVIKRVGKKYMQNGKDTIIYLITQLIKMLYKNESVLL